MACSKKKVVKHLKEDMKESKESLKEDMSLSKYLKMPKKKKKK